MAESGNTLKVVEALAISLLVLAVIFGLTFVATSKLKENICESTDGGFYSGGDCVESATNATVAESDAFLAVEDVETAVQVALAFLGLIVLISILVVIIRQVRAATKG